MIIANCCRIWAPQVTQWQRICLPLQKTQETWVPPLGWEDPLEEEMATHSSITAWRSPWTEEPGGLQCMASQTVVYHWVTEHTRCRLHRKAITRVNLESSHHKENVFPFFLSFLFFESIKEDRCEWNLLWSSSHSICEWNHYSTCLKLIQRCMSITSQ